VRVLRIAFFSQKEFIKNLREVNCDIGSRKRISPRSAPRPLRRREPHTLFRLTCFFGSSCSSVFRVFIFLTSIVAAALPPEGCFYTRLFGFEQGLSASSLPPRCNCTCG
jgi:hypothetical protein